MRHVPDGMLRRLEDEPLAVPDRVADHLSGCERCARRRAEIVENGERAARLFSAPTLVPDVDLAWARLQPALRSGPTDRPVRHQPSQFRVPRVSLRTGLALVAVGVVVAGTAVAATLTTVFAPTHVAPISVSQSELRAIAEISGLLGGNGPGGLASPSGSRTLRFGTLTWSSNTPQNASSVAQAAREAGFPVSLPSHMPSGVGGVQQVGVQPRLTASVTFNATAGSLAGTSVSLTAGPAVVAQYGGAGGTGVPTLGIATMRRPTARSAGATTRQIEAFLLSQPGIPPALAEEIRLLGDPRTTLPVPVPPGAAVRSVHVRGWPAVLLGDPSNAASAVIWEDGRGLLHAVVGLLDSQDVLNVADQVG